MKVHWLRQHFLSNIKYTFGDGSTGRNLILFGFPLILRPPSLVTETRGFMLSLHNLVIIGESDMKIIGLLSRVVGEEVSAEVPHPENAYSTHLNGHDYTVTPVTRYNGYNRIKRWHKTKIRTVYGITSPTDPILPPYTFAPSEWEGRRPSVLEVVKVAHSLNDLGRELIDVRL